MRLALIYPGDPDKAKVINAETGEEVEGLVDLKLESPLRGTDRLTLTVLLGDKKAAAAKRGQAVIPFDPALRKQVVAQFQGERA